MKLLRIYVVIVSLLTAQLIVMQTHAGTIIILNGASSSGKSSAAHALQQEMSAKHIPTILIGLDQMLGMISKQWMPWETPPQLIAQDGLRLMPQEDGSITISLGVVAHKAFKGIFGTLAAFADQDLTVIFEGVIPVAYIPYMFETLKKHTVIFVGIDCSIEVMQKREKERNGFVGLARATLEHLKPHAHNRYNIIINTTHKTPAKSAQEIVDYYHSTLKN